MKYVIRESGDVICVEATRTHPDDTGAAYVVSFASFSSIFSRQLAEAYVALLRAAESPTIISARPKTGGA